MNILNKTTLSSIIAAILFASAAVADTPRPVNPPAATPVPKKIGKVLQVPKHAEPVVPNLELDDQLATPNSGFGTTSAFTASAGVSPDTVIGPPVTITT